MPRRNFYQAVIFNFEGVLLDTERITCDAWKRAGAEFGYPMPEPLVRTLIGLPPNTSAPFLRQIYGDAFPFDAVYERMVIFACACFDNWGMSLKRGTTAMMEILDRLNVRKAIVAESRQQLIDKWTLHTGLFVHFPVSVSSDDLVLRGTPSNNYFLAAERLHVDAERCLVIEHSDFGVRTAHAAGMTVILIPGLQRPSTHALSNAYRVELSLEHLMDDLPQLLETSPDNGSQQRAVIPLTVNAH